MKDRGGGEKLESSRSKEREVLGRGRALPGSGVAGGGGDVEEKEMGLGKSEGMPSQIAQSRALNVQISRGGSTARSSGSTAPVLSGARANVPLRTVVPLGTAVVPLGAMQR